MNNASLLKLKQNFEEYNKEMLNVGPPEITRPFILMKNKEIENIKQLKQGTGNQIAGGKASVGVRS